MRCTTKMRIMEILRLWEMDLTQREIANSVKCGKTTVGEIQDRCINAGLTYDQASHLMHIPFSEDTLTAQVEQLSNPSRRIQTILFIE